jgi:starch synthase (maltosyl-transferring)
MPESNVTPTIRTRRPKAVRSHGDDSKAGGGGIALSRISDASQISPAIYYVDRSPTEDDVREAAALGFNMLGVPQFSLNLLSQVSQAVIDTQLSLIVDLDLTVLRDDLHVTDGQHFHDQSDEDGAVEWWSQQITALQDMGIRGFRCLEIGSVPARIWKRLLASAKHRNSESLFLAWTPGISLDQMPALADAGFDFSFSSSCWWDFKAGWLNDDAQRMMLVAPSIALVTPPNALWPSDSAQRLRALELAAFYGAGWLMPAGFEACTDRDLTQDVIRLNNLRRKQIALRAAPSARVISSPGAETAMLERVGQLAFIVNPSTVRATAFGLHVVAGRLPGRLNALSGDADVDDVIDLLPAASHIFALEKQSLITRRDKIDLDCDAPRIAIEAITPKVDDGQFPVRRIIGDSLVIEADLITDGHDKIAAEIMWRSADESEWRQSPMTLVTNDRWVGNVALSRIGQYVYRVVAWKDFYASFVDEITKKHNAGISIHLELQEGILLLREALKTCVEPAHGRLVEVLDTLANKNDQETLTILLSQHVVQLMKAADPRKFALMSSDILVEAERPLARFASWYEIFPRSQSGDGTRHGTFADVIGQLPRIAAMGFDVLYFPPIHPIGRINRKGKNNTLTPAADDPGSPYAIGAAEGGHDAVHPELGNIADFESLVKAAHDFGMEIALDFAIQCAPDHPWLTDHKEWFDWRPDGSLRYAENPPKKYEDIVNVDFYRDGAKPSLWLALRDVVQFWVDRGVRLFRVDNPHTKPLPFWEWLISDIRSRHPDAIFLAEAFTRPKVMYRLAKIGFSQSYTYFTWRNTKAEIMEYVTELKQPPQREFFGPHFFVNTPDINPVFLQRSGRAGFLIRAALASTLSGLWGVYNGFELCDAKPLTPGKEEYLDSEKYQLRAWEYDSPGNIVLEITKLNAIRRANAALHTHLGIQFHTAFDADVLYFSKSAEDGNTILVAICLDPFNAHETAIEVPLWLFDLPDDASLAVTDLMRDYDFTWHGKIQTVALHPGSPFCIWRIRPEGE